MNTHAFKQSAVQRGKPMLHDMFLAGIDGADLIWSAIVIVIAITIVGDVWLWVYGRRCKRAAMRALNQLTNELLAMGHVERDATMHVIATLNPSVYLKLRARLDDMRPR